MSNPSTTTTAPALAREGIAVLESDFLDEFESAREYNRRVRQSIVRVFPLAPVIGFVVIALKGKR